MIFFSKGAKFYVDFENAIIDRQWSAVNVLKGGPKISDPTKRHNTQVNLFGANGILGWKCCRADFSRVLDHLTCSFPKDVLKEEL